MQRAKKLCLRKPRSKRGRRQGEVDNSPLSRDRGNCVRRRQRVPAAVVHVVHAVVSARSALATMESRLGRSRKTKIQEPLTYAELKSFGVTLQNSRLYPTRKDLETCIPLIRFKLQPCALLGENLALVGSLSKVWANLYAPLLNSMLFISAVKLIE